MDRSATPWRVLDEATVADPAGGTGPSTPETADARAGLPRLSWTVIGGLGLAAALAVGAFVLAASAPRGDVSVEGGTSWPASGSPRASGSTSSSAATLVVDVQGAVLQPGLRELRAGSRVGDAIAAAGGYGPRVDAERAGRELNLAAMLKDGDRLVIPSRDDAAPSPGSAGSSGAGGGGPGDLVDLNTATAAQLDELPGVGPVTAKKIIDARTAKPFASVDELRDRKLVGPSTFEKLRDLVTVR